MAEQEKVTRGGAVLDLELREGVVMVYGLGMTHKGGIGAQGRDFCGRVWTMTRIRTRASKGAPPAWHVPAEQGLLASAPVPSRLQGAQATLGRNILETSSPSSPSPSTYQSCPSSPPLGYHRAELKATYASSFAVAQKGEWDICTSITSQVC